MVIMDYYFKRKTIDLQEKIDSIIEKKEMRQKFVDNGVKFVNEQYDYHKHYIQFEKIISRCQ